MFYIQVFGNIYWISLRCTQIVLICQHNCGTNHIFIFYW